MKGYGWTSSTSLGGAKTEGVTSQKVFLHNIIIRDEIPSIIFLTPFRHSEHPTSIPPLKNVHYMELSAANIFEHRTVLEHPIYKDRK